MKTLLLPRAKSSQYLTFLLCALIACPSNVPTSERDDARADQGTPAPPPSDPGPGPRLHKPERKASHDQPDWSVVADEPEAPVGLDDVRVSPLALHHQPLDLPSLVPSSLAWRPVGPARPVVPPGFAPPLRC